MSEPRSQFGVGPLSKVAALLYTLLTIELLVLLAAAPGLVPLVLLDLDASNIPLVAACAVPLGPALSAAVYALRRRSLDLTDLHPARTFWRGYRANVAQTLLVWVPLLLLLTVLTVNLAHFGDAAVPGWWAALLLLIALLAGLAGLNALIIVSLFTFRTRDVIRLAVYLVARTPKVTIGNVGLLVVAAGVAALVSVPALALVASLFALALLANGAHLIDTITKEFTA